MQPFIDCQFASASHLGFESSFQPMWGVNPAGAHPLPEVLSRLPDYLRTWVNSIATKLDVDPGMALATLLSGMCAGLNGGVVVKRPDDGIEPLACFTVVLAGPTSGKTRTHKLVHSAHNEHDIRLYNNFQRSKKRLRREEAAGEDCSLTPMGSQRLRSVILQDTSNRGLLEALEGVGESTAISVHEGQQVLESVLFRRHLDTLNVLHDGEGRAMITRGKGDCVIAYNAMLTTLIMVQPDIFMSYLQRYGDMARGIGFLARCLFVVAPRIRAAADYSIKDPDEHLKTYHGKVESFLMKRQERLERGEAAPDTLVFSPKAVELWHELTAQHRNLTLRMYWQVQDAANRAMQNVARLAGIIHSYSDEVGDISADCLEAAWLIVQWHMTQFVELFPPKALPPPPPLRLTTQQKQQLREVEDGKAIVNCISAICWRNQEPDALKSKVFVRSGLYNARFRTALMRLVDEGVVLESGQGVQMRLSIVSPREGISAMKQAWQNGFPSRI